jgi:hypothetical protein
MPAVFCKSTAAIAVAMLVMSGQAQALSCLPADAVRTFAELDAAPEAYIVLHGTLTFDESTLPPFVQDEPFDAPSPIPAEFNGKGLTADGFTVDRATPMLLQLTCAGPWCGTAQSGQEAIIFVPVSEAPMTVTVGPCGGQFFPDPAPETLAMLTTCMQGGDCSAE